MFVQNYFKCFLIIIFKKIIGEYSYLKLRFGLSKDKYEYASNFFISIFIEKRDLKVT